MYTSSVDGKHRDSIKFELRLTREEKEKYNRIAQQMGFENLRDYINSQKYGLLIDPLSEKETHHETR